MPANLENSAVATGLERSVFIPKIPKKGNAKECSNYRTIAFISHTSKVILKILQARFQQNVNHELPDVQTGFRKGTGARDQLPTSAESSKKQESSRKTSSVQFGSVQSLSHVRLFATPWIAACQASLSITNSGSLLKLIPIESVMPSSHLILCCPLLLLQWVNSSHEVAKVLEFQLQPQSFQWTPRTDLL